MEFCHCAHAKHPAICMFAAARRWSTSIPAVSWPYRVQPLQPFWNSEIGQWSPSNYLGWSQMILPGPSSWLETCERLAELVWNWRGIHELFRYDFIGCHQNVYQNEMRNCHARICDFGPWLRGDLTKTRNKTMHCLQKICKCCATEAWLELLYHRQPRALLRLQLCFLFLLGPKQMQSTWRTRRDSRSSESEDGFVYGMVDVHHLITLCCSAWPQANPLLTDYVATRGDLNIVAFNFVADTKRTWEGCSALLHPGWYRAPELLLGSTIYSEALASWLWWNCGAEHWYLHCIFFKLWLPLLKVEILITFALLWIFVSANAAGCGYVERGLHAGRDGPHHSSGVHSRFLPRSVIWTAITQVAGKPILRGRCRVCHLYHLCHVSALSRTWLTPGQRWISFRRWDQLQSTSLSKRIQMVCDFTTRLI